VFETADRVRETRVSTRNKNAYGIAVTPRSIVDPESPRTPVLGGYEGERGGSEEVGGAVVEEGLRVGTGVTGNVII
jgi:hypothetical protein